MSDDKIKPPQCKVVSYYDEHDANGSRLFEKFIKKNEPIELLLKATKEYASSTNPDGKKMSILCRGLYFRKKADKEKDNEKAKKLLLKAITQFKNVDPDDEIVKQTELVFIKRKLQIEKDNPNPKLFERAAHLSKDLGRESEYHRNMFLYYMFILTGNGELLNREEIQKNANAMLAHAKQSDNETILKRVEILYHEIKGGVSFNPKEKLQEFEKAIDIAKGIKEKVKIDVIETEAMMTKAMLTVNTEKRNKLLLTVAEKYKAQGQKRREDFVRKLLSPIPLKAARIVFLSDKSLEKLRQLEQKILQHTESKGGPSAIFYYLSYMMERIKDVKRILIRMANTRKRITILNIQSNAFRPKRVGIKLSKKVQAVERESDRLREQMKQDMESLLIFGNLLLDQWSYLVGCIAGYDIPEKPKFSTKTYYKGLLNSFSDSNCRAELQEFWTKNKNKAKDPKPELNHVGLLNLLQNKKYRGELKVYWERHKKDIIWLNFLVRFYRNIFIEHLRKPWQRGHAMGSFTEDFNFFIVAPAGYVSKNIQSLILNKIYDIAPQRLKNLPDTSFEKKNPKRVLEIALHFIDEVDEQSAREKIWEAWDLLGGSTPSYDTIAARLFNYIYSSINTMLEFIDNNPKLLKLGKFNLTVKAEKVDNK